VLDKWLGKLRGRLSILAVIMVSSLVRSQAPRSPPCALLGTILLPDMLKKGYSKNMSLGPLMGVGTVDALIPPNALTVVLASLANIDVGQLLIAGIVPGLIIVLALSHLYHRLVSYFSRGSTHVRCATYPLERESDGHGHLSSALGLIIFMVIGFIFLGVATPTEAAATGPSLLYPFRRIQAPHLDVMKKAVMGTVKVTTMIFMIIIVSSTYGEILAFTVLPRHDQLHH